MTVNDLQQICNVVTFFLQDIGTYHDLPCAGAHTGAQHRLCISVTFVTFLYYMYMYVCMNNLCVTKMCNKIFEIVTSVTLLAVNDLRLKNESKGCSGGAEVSTVGHGFCKKLSFSVDTCLTVFNPYFFPPGGTNDTVPAPGSPSPPSPCVPGGRFVVHSGGPPRVA